MTEGRLSTIAQVSPMITYVTLPEATANIVQLLDRVSQGEEIIISQAGQPIAHISPAPRDRSPHVPGQYAGKLIIPDDFNDPLPDDILDGFLNPAGL
jgi:prevent-host-death family protein